MEIEIETPFTEVQNTRGEGDIERNIATASTENTQGFAIEVFVISH